MDSDKMTIKELKSILRKKDFLLQVKRQTWLKGWKPGYNTKALAT
jgi:hypothetical protein